MEASGAPILSTPAEHIFEAPEPSTVARSFLSEEQLYVQYEIRRTVKEIRDGRWKRVALQFPDEYLGDATRIVEGLGRELRKERKMGKVLQKADDEVDGVAEGVSEVKLAGAEGGTVSEQNSAEEEEERLTILADTSYGACCVDEVAAEHVSADVVIHYGRSCVSPTTRLPVIYVFTTKPLDLDAAVNAFERTYIDKSGKIVLMADIPYQHNVPELVNRLRQRGYESTFATEIMHNPSSALPNRTVPDEVGEDQEALKQYSVFHISDPPASLLLTLSSRVDRVHIFPTTSANPTAIEARTTAQLRRRYALLTRVATAPIIGILINTLSVKNYMTALSHCQDLVAKAGKKSYTFVVGKLNAAKVANFAEVGGWVVIGCWESSLVESSEFYKPVVTPFELEVALTDEKTRVWDGEWVSDFGALLGREMQQSNGKATGEVTGGEQQQQNGSGDLQDETSDDEPPEFDLRTGRYVSHSRPMGRSTRRSNPASNGTETSASAAAPPSSSLIQRTKGDIASVNGAVSPGAEFLRSKREWKGLGSDYEIQYERDEEGKIQGAAMEEGRGGVARGYGISGERGS